MQNIKQTQTEKKYHAILEWKINIIWLSAKITCLFSIVFDQDTEI